MFHVFPRSLAFSFLLTIFLVITAFAQPDGYVEVRHKRSIPVDRHGCYRETDGVYDQAKLDDLLRDNNCNEAIRDLTVDPATETLIRYSGGGDCHVRVVARVYRVDAEKKIKVIVNNIYGGCRAGGWRHGWIVIEKLPPGYTVENIAVGVDRPRSPELPAFVFPKPPTTKARTPIPVSEVDMKGCLPTTGQSRWTIQTAEHLKNALEQKPADKARCSEHLESLNIDLETQTLALNAFASGYCERPVGLTFDAESETSSDPTEDRTIVNIRYQPVGVGDACKVWTTYPLWVVVPKLPESHKLDFEVVAKYLIRKLAAC